MTTVQTTTSVEDATASAVPGPQNIRVRAAQFWVQTFVGLAQSRPRTMRRLRGFGVGCAWVFSPVMRRATLANAGRILGSGSAMGARRRLARAMIGSFYDFLLDMGRHRNSDVAKMMEEVECVEGNDGYRRARAAGKGAILVTAHIGSFEVGATILKSLEPMVWVVFQRDPMPVFERLRTEMHERAGLMEAPVNPTTGEDGWTVWLKLRDALVRDEVVLMQGDRVMPGQRGHRLPFLGGHIVMPPGPVKLALATGSPIIPVCSVRTRDGRVRIILERPIWVEPRGSEGPHPAELELAKVLENWVRQFADQWMMVQPVWCEDGAGGARTTP